MPDRGKWVIEECDLQPPVKCECGGETFDLFKEVNLYERTITFYLGCALCARPFPGSILKVKKKATAKQREKAHKVFDEGKKGKLHSGSKSGPVVKHGSKQEIAIALSESGQSKKRKKKK